MKPVKLADEWIADGYPCYVVAEIGNLFKNFEEAKVLHQLKLEFQRKDQLRGMYWNNDINNLESNQTRFLINSEKKIVWN